MKINNLRISLFTIITLSIFLIASGVLVYKNAVGLLTAWNQANKMVVYLKVDTPTNERDSLIVEIKKETAVSDVQLIDRLKAGKAFQNSLKEFSTGLITEDEMLDLIPETLEVELNTKLDLSERENTFARLSEKLKSHSFVDETSYGAASLKKFERLDQILRSSGLFVGFILALCISYLVSLMIRVYIDDSKSEIEVYSLLGSTRWAIYKLFLKDILLFLSSSLVVAYIALFALYSFLKHKLSSSSLSNVLSDNIQFLNSYEIFTLSVLLFILVYSNSFITIQRSVNKLNQLTNE